MLDPTTFPQTVSNPWSMRIGKILICGGSLTSVGSSGVEVVFPRPYASAPAVVAAQFDLSGGTNVWARTKSATSVIIKSATEGQKADWISIGVGL